MKRLVLLSLVALVGCDRIDSDRPRAYACDPTDRADRTQCPGGWLCTLDGVCANPDAGADFACETAEDCTGGWMCALNGRCVDPRVGRPLPCVDGSDCPGQWVCGLTQQCLDPDAGVAWPCEHDEDCTAGWHCGVQGVCYDRTTAEGVACRRDAGVDDCAPGWRCGLEDVCHSTEVGAALICRADSDCEQGWRCAATGRCVDAELDLLRPTGTTAPTVEEAFPSIVPRDVRVVAGRASLAAFAGDGGLRVVLPSTEYLTDGGQELRLRVGDRALPTAPTALATEEIFNSVWLARAGGVLERHVFDPSGQLIVATTVPLRSPDGGAFTATHLRTTSADVLAWSDTEVALVEPSGTIASWSAATLPDAGRITDVADVSFGLLRVGASSPDGYRTLVLMTERGAWGLSVAAPDAGWHQLGFESTGLMFPTRLAAHGVKVVAAVQMGDDRQRTAFRPLDLGTAMAGRASLRAGSGEDLHISFAAPLDDCSPRGLFAHSAFDGGLTWVGTCRFPDGGVAQTTDRDLWLGDRWHTLDATMTLSAHEPIRATPGRAWAGGEDLRFGPLVPDRRVGQLAGAARAPVVELPAREFRGSVLDCQSGQFDCETDDIPAWCTGTSGRLWCNPAVLDAKISRVRGRSDWLAVHNPASPVTAVAYQVEPGTFAARGTGAATNVAFSRAGPSAMTSAPDGGIQQLLALDDRVLSATLSGPQPLNTFRVQASFAFNALPGARVTSLAPLPPGPGPVLHAEGYVIAQGRLFRYSAENPVVWLTEELPLSSSEAFAVWSDGRRARVVFRDGAVFGLPSRVMLAPSAGVEVLELEPSCEQTFAMMTDGLYRLESSSADRGLGRWTKLDAGVGPLTGARLLSEEPGRLLVARPDGTFALLGGFGCTP